MKSRQKRFLQRRICFFFFYCSVYCNYSVTFCDFVFYALKLITCVLLRLSVFRSTASFLPKQAGRVLISSSPRNGFLPHEAITTVYSLNPQLLNENSIIGVWVKINLLLNIRLASTAADLM